MARRAGGSGGRPKKSASPEYGMASAKQYQQQTRERLKQQAIRAWMIRLIVVALLAYAGWKLGPPLLSRMTQKGRQATYELQKSQQGVKKATDERSGANFNPNE